MRLSILATIVALLLAVAAPLPAAAQAAMPDAYAAYVNGDDATARALWRELADGGDIEAAFMLADSHLNGPPATADRPLALDWYRFAAERGHVEAQFALGAQHMSDGEALWPGEDAVPHFVAAAHWFSLAAGAGHAPARHQLGRLHLNGAGVPENPETTRELWTLAAAQGYRESYAVLPLFDFEVPEETRDLWTRYDTLMSAGTRPGPVLFPIILLPLAEAGHMLAQFDLALLLLARPGSPHNLATAEHWLRAARRQGDIRAYHMLMTLALERAGHDN